MDKHNIPTGMEGQGPKDDNVVESSIEQHSGVSDSAYYSGGNTSNPSTSGTSDEAMEFLTTTAKEISSSSTFCSKVLSSQHLFNEELYLTDPSKSIEREAVEAKLGKIILRRVFSSSDLDFLKEKTLIHLRVRPLRASKSWSDFGQWTKQTKGQFKRSLKLPDPESFSKACEVYKMLIKVPNQDFRDRFQLATYLLPKYYPNYWKYLKGKYCLDMNDDSFLEEVECKFKVTKSCTDILEEEEVYHKNSIDVIGKRRWLQIKGKLYHLNRDFHAASEFLMKEYPAVFTYLIQKYEFAKFLMDRLSVEKNKLLVIEASIQPLQKLVELEAKYTE